ncbi:MAG: hypothetical protein M9904_14040 [Chitinophagaceae bacterium]|nr:hypothetical protein [Chitinophagaceae bacterium]
MRPLLLQDYQRFITGPELKEDLKNIVLISILWKLKRRKFKNVPPIIDSSNCFPTLEEFSAILKKVPMVYYGVDRMKEKFSNKKTI